MSSLHSIFSSCRVAHHQLILESDLLHHSFQGSLILLFLTAITPVPFAWLTVVITILIIPSPVLCSNGDLECIHRWVDVLSQTVHDQWCTAGVVILSFLGPLSFAFAQMLFCYTDIGCF
ncbi:hypothetical protein K438DRAFT_201705 [Mycena galopus ATCC 62051]|nr:hypothetical protein K438DRAFT_201705 [Mycena galopus ATCC 62051]